MARNGGNINLSTKWALNVLKSVDWVKRKGTTAKKEVHPERNRAQIVLEHNFHQKRVLTDSSRVLFSQLKWPILIREANLYQLPMQMINVKLQLYFASVYLGNCNLSSFYTLDTGRKLNVHKTFNLRPVFKGYLADVTQE